MRIASFCTTTMAIGVGLFASAMAQTPAQSTLNVGYSVKQSALPKEQSVPTAAISKPSIPFQHNKFNSTLSPQADPPGVKLGFTYYDFQTNACMAERVVVTEEDGSKFAHVMWMAATVSTPDPPATGLPVVGFNDSRGVHYAVLDVSNPSSPELFTDIEWKKLGVENNLRRGWPSIVAFKNGAVGTTNHVPIRFYYNSSTGDLGFRSSEVTEAGSAEQTLWARAAIDGQENIHVIYTFQDTPGKDREVYYRRSSNKGQTWSQEVTFTGSTAQGGSYPSGQGGDTYAISANGSNIVAMYGTSGLQVLYRKSTDFGETWSLPFVVMNTEFTVKRAIDDDFGNVQGFTDTLISCGNQMDVIVDNAGMAHFVYNEMYAHVVRDGVRMTPDSVNYTGGTIYSLDEIEKYGSSNLGFWYQPEGSQYRYRIAKPAGDSWDGNGEVVSRRTYSGLCRFPQLGLDAENNLYMVYTSVKNGDAVKMSIDTTTVRDGIVDMEVNALFGHAYVTHKPAGGMDWSKPKDITPTGKDCLFATLGNTVDGHLHIAYSADNTPGDRVTSAELPTEETDVYYYPFPANQLSNEFVTPERVDVSVSLTSVEEDAAILPSTMLYPNPADELVTLVSEGNVGVVVVEIFNQFGVKVIEKQGQNVITVHTGNLTSGAYFAVLRTAAGTTTTPFSIIR